MNIKPFLLLLIASTIVTSCELKTEQPKPEKYDNEKQQPSFDQALAASLGADEYGMKKYVLAFLKAGPNRDQDSLSAAKLQKAHLDNIQALAKAGKLSLAGPFLDNGNMRGIYIFNVESVEEAKKLTETDPAIRAGRLTMELHPWYGSAALQQVTQIHDKVAKTKF